MVSRRAPLNVHLRRLYISLGVDHVNAQRRARTAPATSHRHSSRCARAHPHGVHGAGARQTGATWLLSSRLKVCDVTVNHHLCTGPQRRAEQHAARATATALARRSAPHAPAPSLLLLRASAARTQAHAARNLRVVHDSLSVRGLLMRASARLNQFGASCVCVSAALFLSLYVPVRRRVAVHAAPIATAAAHTHTPSLALVPLEPVARMGHTIVTLPDGTAPAPARPRPSTSRTTLADGASTKRMQRRVRV